MKRFSLALGSLAVWASVALDASAAWNNVYQPTLFGRHRRSTSSYYVAPAVAYASPVVAAASPCCPAPAPCPQQCSTSYIQRCYYQPVTTYQTQTYYEPVTTMQKSYYYEPVTSYRYSCYYDPCTCSYQQVATPTTSYQLREKCCPVQSWVARCAQVPVTTYQKACYLQPQTTCCQTTTGPLIPTAAVGGAAYNGVGVAAPYNGFNGGVAAPYNGNGASFGGPQINVNPPQIQVTPPQTNPPPQIKDGFAPSGPNVGNMSRGQPNGQPNGWQAAPTQAVPTQNPTPPVKLDRIVFGPESYVDGQVVKGDRSPRAGASVLFVSADNGQRHTATANAAGQFQVSLASGNWLVYVPNSDGTALFHSRVNVRANERTPLMVVN
jgi:hypothetical protein